MVAGDAEQAIDPRNAFIMTTMLRDVVRRHRRQGDGACRGDLAGKTGTTNDSVDAWFAGFNQSLVGVAWVGFDQPKSLGERETGGGVALPIWINYMKTALKGVPEIPLKPPGGVVSATVSGDGEGLVDTGAVSDWFLRVPAAPLLSIRSPARRRSQQTGRRGAAATVLTGANASSTRACPIPMANALRWRRPPPASMSSPS